MRDHACAAGCPDRGDGIPGTAVCPDTSGRSRGGTAEQRTLSIPVNGHEDEKGTVLAIDRSLQHFAKKHLNKIVHYT